MGGVHLLTPPVQELTRGVHLLTPGVHLLHTKKTHLKRLMMLVLVIAHARKRYFSTQESTPQRCAKSLH